MDWAGQKFFFQLFYPKLPKNHFLLLYFYFLRPLGHDICKKPITLYVEIQLGCEKSIVAQKFKFPGGLKTNESCPHNIL